MGISIKTTASRCANGRSWLAESFYDDESKDFGEVRTILIGKRVVGSDGREFGVVVRIEPEVEAVFPEKIVVHYRRFLGILRSRAIPVRKITNVDSRFIYLTFEKARLDENSDAPDLGNNPGGYAYRGDRGVSDFRESIDPYFIL